MTTAVTVLSTLLLGLAVYLFQVVRFVCYISASTQHYRTVVRYKYFEPNLRTVKIPTIMHHMSATDAIPERWNNSYETCVLNEDHVDLGYEFKLWTDESIQTFMEKEYPWFMPTFYSYPHHIQRVDAARYFILHYFGGIYLDCDVGCLTDIDYFRFQGVDAMFPVTLPLGVSNDVMVCAPGHPFLDFVIHHLERYNVNWVFKYPTVMFSTGPGFLSRMLHEYALEHSNDNDKNKDEKDRMMSIALIDHDTYTQNAFFHVEGSSWHGWDAEFIKWLWKYLNWITAVVCVAVAIYECFY